MTTTSFLPFSIGGPRSRHIEHDHTLVLVRRRAESCAQRRLAVGGVDPYRSRMSVDAAQVRLLPDQIIDVVSGERGRICERNGISKSKPDVIGHFAKATARAQTDQIRRHNALMT